MLIRQRFEDLQPRSYHRLDPRRTQAEALLGIAAQAGLQVMVELPVTVAEVSSDRGCAIWLRGSSNRSTMARRPGPGSGYLIDCPIDPAICAIGG